MELQSQFAPPRRIGLAFLLSAAVLFGVTGGLGIGIATQESSGSNVVWLILISLALLVVEPVILYRAYSLAQASYTLTRDGLQIRWGLRSEDIPIGAIEWVRPAAEMGFRLPLPWVWWPGAVIGIRRVEGLGVVEFVAAEPRRMLVVATPLRIFVISPADPKAFIRAFRAIIEMGSLSPLVSYSAQPTAFVRQVWDDPLARRLLTACGILFGVLLLSVAVRISTQMTVSLGFDTLRQPLPQGPSVRLLLLPALGAVAVLADVAAGLFLYRRPAQRPAAYLLYAAAALTSLLLLAASLLQR